MTLRLSFHKKQEEETERNTPFDMNLMYPNLTLTKSGTLGYKDLSY